MEKIGFDACLFVFSGCYSMRLVLLDWIAKWAAISRRCGGLWEAWAADAISSRGMREGLQKIIWYIVMLIAANQFDQFFFFG